MSSKKQTYINKQKRQRYSGRHPRNNKHGGKRRRVKKQSPMMKFLSLNNEAIKEQRWQKIKVV